MDDRIEKEIKRREIVSTGCLERFLDPKRALDSIKGQLQERKSPAPATYFKQEKIDAVAPLTKDVSVLLHRNLLVIRVFVCRFSPTEQEKKKKRALLLKPKRRVSSM